jgi:ankyrin repeat protein
LFAAREGCAQCAKYLVEGGADIDLPDQMVVTPLNMAALNARWDVAKVLIEGGADVNRWDYWGRAPLYSTVDYNTVPRGGRPDRPSDDATTPVEIAAMLLERGANPDFQLKLFPPYRSLGNDRGGDSMLTAGTTPLIRASKAGDVEMVTLLLEYGADPNLRNLNGHYPITAAAGIGTTNLDLRARFRNEQDCIETARLLLAAGADINQADGQGRRPVHGAATWGWNEFIRFAVEEAGGDVNAKDDRGLTALNVAMGEGGGIGRSASTTEADDETVALLLELGAQRGNVPE